MITSCCNHLYLLLTLSLILFFIYLWQKSHDLTLPAWSTNGTTWAALRNLSNFNMMWLFKTPERAKLTGGLCYLFIVRISCTKDVDNTLPLCAIEPLIPTPGQNQMGFVVGSFKQEHVYEWVSNNHEETCLYWFKKELNCCIISLDCWRYVFQGRETEKALRLSF